MARSLLLAHYQTATVLLGFGANTPQHRRKSDVLLVLSSNGINIAL